MPVLQGGEATPRRRSVPSLRSARLQRRSGAVQPQRSIEDSAILIPLNKNCATSSSLKFRPESAFMRTVKKTWLVMVTGVACLIALGQPPRAAGFDARPVTIETHGGNIASITVTNPSDRKIYLENSVHEWRQDASGRDVLSDSSAAVVSPPGMWVQPGATYNLRIQLPPASDRELAFRVILQQLPDKTEIQAGRIVFAVTQSLPAFSEPSQTTPAVLRARLIDSLHLLIANDGGRRARLADIKADGRIVGPGLVGYALAHSSVLLTLKSPVRGGTVEIDTDQGRRVVEVR
jgi:P pilus assembly chaperone PapD